VSQPALESSPPDTTPHAGRSSPRAWSSPCVRAHPSQPAPSTSTTRTDPVRTPASSQAQPCTISAATAAHHARATASCDARHVSRAGGCSAWDGPARVSRRWGWRW
jgi:hypothetical protein